MKVFGNIMNRLDEEGAQHTKPEVGMGLTEYCYSDRHAYTVTRVDPKGKKLWAVEDEAKRVLADGDPVMSDSQQYEYSPGTGGEVLFTFRKDNKWHIGTRIGNSVARLGHRDKYYDYGF